MENRVGDYAATNSHYKRNRIEIMEYRAAGAWKLTEQLNSENALTIT